MEKGQPFVPLLFLSALLPAGAEAWLCRQAQAVARTHASPCRRSVRWQRAKRRYLLQFPNEKRAQARKERMKLWDYLLLHGKDRCVCGSVHGQIQVCSGVHLRTHAHVHSRSARPGLHVQGCTSRGDLGTEGVDQWEHPGLNPAESCRQQGADVVKNPVADPERGPRHRSRGKFRLDQDKSRAISWGRVEPQKRLGATKAQIQGQIHEVAPF